MQNYYKQWENLEWLEEAYSLKTFWNLDLNFF